jgi:membrane-bound metal-dependent hydrolase YbcI (DUF457 family)
MPSPIGHALGAMAAGWLAATPSRPGRPLAVQAGLLALIGAAPDLDLLIHHHRAETHSVGAAVIVATLVAWRRWPIGATRPRIWAAACAAWLSHLLLDMTAVDTSAPFGIMCWWPFSRVYVHTGVNLFEGIYRHWWEWSFWTHNTLAVSWELALLGPAAAAVWFIRSGTARRRRTPAAR